MRIFALLLADLLRRPRSVALSVMQLRRRLERAGAELRSCGAEELELAADMRKMRARVADATARPVACTACARKHPLPHGRWPGGYCCGTDTWRVFTDDELWSLAASGTRPWHWTPVTDPAGCLFRGSQGCVLRPENRPNICLRYLCLDLVAEIRARGDFKTVNGMCEALAASFRRLTDLRAARRELAELDSMRRELDVFSSPERRPRDRP